MGMPEELAKLFPSTLGRGLAQPPGTLFGRSLHERPSAEWTDLGNGLTVWRSPWEAP